MRFFICSLAALILIAQAVISTPLEERAEFKGPSKDHAHEKFWGLGGLGYGLGYGGYGGFYPGWGGFGYGGYGGYGLGFLKDKKNHGKSDQHHHNHARLQKRAEAKGPSKDHAHEKLWGLGGLGYGLGYGGYGRFYPGWGGFGYGGYGGYGLGFLKDKKNHGKSAIHHNKHA